MVLAPGADIDCCTQRVCNPGETGGFCNTRSLCNNAGEQHRVEWDHTGCVDAIHHVKIRVDTGGGFVDVQDNISCDAADPDLSCCEVGGCTPDGVWMRRLLVNGALTVDFTYRVQIELDSSHTIVGSPCDATGCTNCGGSTTCLE